MNNQEFSDHIDCILNTWALDDEQKSLILGLNQKDDSVCLKVAEILKVHDHSEYILHRLRLISNIDTSLNILFNNQKNIDGFMKMRNRNSPFNGKRPVDLACQSLESLEQVDIAIAHLFKL